MKKNIREHNGKVEKTADILHSLLARKNWQQRIDLHQVFLFWKEVVGRDVAAHAEPEIIRGKVLWVRVSDSVWMQQLHLQKILLLEKLNNRLKEEKLSDLRFQLDVHAGISFDSPKAKPKKKKRAPAVPQALDKMIDMLDEKGMQEALRRLWCRAHEEEGQDG